MPPATRHTHTLYARVAPRETVQKSKSRKFVRGETTPTTRPQMEDAASEATDPPSSRPASVASEPLASPVSSATPKSTKRRVTSSVALHELMSLEVEQLEGYFVPEDTSRDDDLVLATYGADPKSIHAAAFALAREKRYVAAKNFLVLAQLHDPPTIEENKVCEAAVNATRGKASRKFNGAGRTWADFSADGRDCMRIAHRLLLTKGRRADEQDVWTRMLVRSPEFFGGEPSHLTLALTELVRSAHVDTNRFLPPARVLAYDEKSLGWIPAVLLPTDEGSKSRAGPPPAAAGKKLASPRKMPDNSTPRSTYDSESDDDGESKPAPSSFDRLFKASTAASSVSKASNTLVRKKDDGPPPLHVRFRATGDLPQRTVWLKRASVMRDVGRGMPAAYLPGVILLEAAAAGLVGLVEALIDANVSIYEVDDEATPAMLHAGFNCSTEGHRAVCKLLMDKGSDPDTRNMNSVSPWDCALMRSDRQLRRILRPSDSDKDCTPKAMAATELHRAIFAGDEAVALTVLDHAAGRLENGFTPLHAAARMCMLKVVQALLDRGARPEQKTARGCTAFALAAEEGHVSILRSMLATRCAPEFLFAADEAGMTPLMRACENGHLDAAELLIEHGGEFDVNGASLKGWSPLMLACCNGYEEMVELLLDQNAEADLGRQIGTSKNAATHTPLCYAASCGHAKCVKLLLNDEVTFEEQRGATALELAKRSEHWDCADALDAVLGTVSERPVAEPAKPTVQTKLKTKLSSDLSRVMDVFKSADVNSDKSVSIDEFRDAMGKAGISATEEEIQECFGSMDADNSSSIDFAELNKVLRRDVKEEKVPPMPVRERSHKTPKRVKKQEEAPAPAFEAPVDPNDLKALQARLAELADELADLRIDKRRMRSDLTSALEAAALEAKQPWAYSPSGRWRPGLWSGAVDRNAPISHEHGEPAKSVALVDMLPLGMSSLWSA